MNKIVRGPRGIRKEGTMKTYEYFQNNNQSSEEINIIGVSWLSRTFWGNGTQVNTGKMKKKGNVVLMKQSRSASDITREILDRKDEFRFFRSRLGARSLSHDSFFLSETRHSDPKPPWVLSQETVHGKIQALQIKLQRQNMRLGPPPLVLPMKQAEDNRQPSEVLMSKNLPHKSSSQGDFLYPISPTLPPVPSSAPSPGVDFSTLPQLIPCLDNSAARHRMSIKPRNQRASTKSRRTPPSDGSRPRSESMIILERPLPEHTEDGIAITKEITRVRSYSSQIIRPGKGHIAPPTKSPGPFSPPKLLVGADDDSYPCAVGQCKGKEEPAVSNTADGGTKQILKLAEGIVVERSSGPNSRKGSVDHKESLCSSKPKDVEGSAVSVVSSVYTPCLILSGTGQSQPKSDKELNMVTAQIKGNASNRNDPRVQATMQEYYLQGQPLKSLTLHRNTSPLNNKSESGNINQISSLLLSKEEGCPQESTIQQQSQSFSVSLDKSQERQRTGSFTEQIEQAEGKQEPVFPLIKPLTNLKTQDLHKNTQVMTTGKDPSQTGATSTPAVLTKPKDLTINVSAGQERRNRPANKTQDMAVETPIEVKETDDANKKLKMNKVSQEEKEERSASELKLDTTYPSEVRDKQHNTEVGRTPWLPEFTTPIAVGQNDSKEPVRETVFRSPPLYNTQLFSPAEFPLFSNIQPQSTRSDQERAGLIRFPDLQASTQLAGSTINITMSTPVHGMEGDPLQTSARDSREASIELSWMTMAREKTKSLQQLFTSTLNDLAGLQTVTRPAASTLTQISSQCTAGPINPAAAQSSDSPLETQLTSTLPASIQATHPIQPPPLKSSISLAQTSIDWSGGVDFSTKPNTSPTSQVQPIHLNARSGQMSADSTLKPVKSTGIYMPSSQIIHATQQQLSQMALHQAYPIQQSLSQSVTKPQASQSLRRSHSPKLAPRQPPHQSLSPVSQHRPLVENISSLLLEKMDWTSMPQEKSPTVGQAQYTGGLGSKALLIDQWQHQKPETVKADQKSTPESQTYQYLDEFPTISGRSKFTELAVSPRPMRLEREVKWQKTSFSPLSPSSSPHLQSNREGRQPSWMELAKRKSMAWSDKSMD